MRYLYKLLAFLLTPLGMVVLYIATLLFLCWSLGQLIEPKAANHYIQTTKIN